MTATTAITASTAVTLVPIESYPTPAGATVHLHRDTDGSLSSDCTGCGEYAWTLQVTREFAREHASTCNRRPRTAAAPAA